MCMGVKYASYNLLKESAFSFFYHLFVGFLQFPKTANEKDYTPAHSQI